MSAPEKTSPRAWLRPALIFFVFVLLFYRFWSHTIIYRDSFTYFAPNKYLIGQALRKLTLYAWFPYQFLGLPNVADIQRGIFYPLNILFVFLPLGLAHRLFILIHYPLAAIFMDLFLRGRGIDRRASLVAALAFPLGGYMISMHSMVSMLIGPCLAPLALYFMDRALATAAFAPALGAAGVLALQILGGDPQSAAVTAVLITFISLSAFFTRPRRAGSLAGLVLVGVFAAGLCAAQLLPTIEIMRYSQRASGIRLREALGFSYHPGRLIELIWPTTFVNLQPDYTEWGYFTVDSYNMSMPWTVTCYLGLPLVILAIVGLLYGRRNYRGWLALGIIAFLGLGLGRFAGLYPFFYKHVPLFSAFRYPEKYMVWFTMLIIVAAALGLETLLRRASENKADLKRWGLWYITGLLASSVAAYFLWPAAVKNLIDLMPGSEPYQYGMSAIWSGGKQWFMTNLIIALILILIGKETLSVPRGLYIFIGVLILDYWMINVNSMPSGPKDIFEFRSIAGQAISPQGRPALGQYRILRDGMKHSSSNPAIRELTFLEKSAIWCRNIMYDHFDAFEGFENIRGNNEGMQIQLKDLRMLYGKPGLGVLEFLNVAYLISQDTSDYAKSVGAKPIFSDPLDGIMVSKLPAVFPRAYFVPTAKTAADDVKAWKTFQASNPNNTTVLTTTEKIEEKDPRGLSMKPAKIIKYEPDRMTIEADAPADGWLVITDRYYPGWLATVDGKPARVYKANGIVRSIPVPAGRHRVELSFYSASLKIGIWVSLLAWMALIILVIAGRENIYQKKVTS